MLYANYVSSNGGLITLMPACCSSAASNHTVIPCAFNPACLNQSDFTEDQIMGEFTSKKQRGLPQVLWLCFTMFVFVIALLLTLKAAESFGLLHTLIII